MLNDLKRKKDLALADNNIRGRHNYLSKQCEIYKILDFDEYIRKWEILNDLSNLCTFNYL